MNRFKELWGSIKIWAWKLSKRYYLVEIPDRWDAMNQFCVINPCRCICLFAIQKHSGGDLSIIVLNAELFLGRGE